MAPFVNSVFYADMNILVAYLNHVAYPHDDDWHQVAGESFVRAQRLRVINRRRWGRRLRIVDVVIVHVMVGVARRDGSRATGRKFDVVIIVFFLFVFASFHAAVVVGSTPWIVRRRLAIGLLVVPVTPIRVGARWIAVVCVVIDGRVLAANLVFVIIFLVASVARSTAAPASVYRICQQEITEKWNKLVIQPVQTLYDHKLGLLWNWNPFL